jgi:hypothetical protein
MSVKQKLWRQVWPSGRMMELLGSKYVPLTSSSSSPLQLARLADNQAEHWTRLPPGQNRDSVRITSHSLYSGGLFLIDLELMPWGCGIWPACESTFRNPGQKT